MWPQTSRPPFSCRDRGRKPWRWRARRGRLRPRIIRRPPDFAGHEVDRPTRSGRRVVLGRHLPEMQKRTVLISAAAVQGTHTPVKQKPYSLASRNSNFRRSERSGQLASPRRSPQ